MTDNQIRTITLTGRPPVKVSNEDWGLIASANDMDHDNQYDFQANRISKWFVGVRQHDDGRTIVYATYSHTSNYQGERGYSAKRGVLLPVGTTVDQIADSVFEVCKDIAQAEHQGEDAGRWTELMHKCLADLPAEEL